MTEDVVEKENQNPAEDSKIELETKAIIGKVKDGDNQAFSRLVQLYKNQVASLAYKVTGDYDEAADITQNVFVKISKNIWRYNESKKFYTWLYRITVNASIDYMRKHRRHQHDSIENISEKADDNLVTPGLMESDAVSLYERNEQVALDLQAGRIDLGIMDLEPGKQYIADPDFAFVEVWRGPMDPSGQAIAIMQGETELKAELDKHIADLLSEGFVRSTLDGYGIE